MFNLISERLFLHRPFPFNLELKSPRSMIIFFPSEFKIRRALLPIGPSEKNKVPSRYSRKVSKKRLADYLLEFHE